MWTKDQSDNPRRWYALLVFAVLQAGDYLSTRLAFASPSAVSCNGIFWVGYGRYDLLLDTI